MHLLYFISIAKSRSNTILEPTSTEPCQLRYFVFKETTTAFGGYRNTFTDYEPNAPTTPQRRCYI